MRLGGCLLVLVALVTAACGTAGDGAPPTSTTQPATTTPTLSTTPPPPASGRATSTTVRASPDRRVLTLDLVDTSRPAPEEGRPKVAQQRELPTTVYLPPDTGPAPLIVLAHGANGHPDKFTELATYWSGAGYVVAVPRFPLSSNESEEVNISDIVGQGGDVSFVIDEVLARNSGSGPLAGRVDPERIGLFGLSLGSLSVWYAVLGECCRDDRIDALIQSDGYLPFPEEDPAAVPFPVMIAHSDVDPIFAYADVRAVFEALSDSAVLLTLHGAVHAMVAENTDTPADLAYQQATTVFWNRHLGDKAGEAFPPTVAIDGVTSIEGDGVALPTAR